MDNNLSKDFLDDFIDAEDNSELDSNEEYDEEFLDKFTETAKDLYDYESSTTIDDVANLFEDFKDEEIMDATSPQSLIDELSKLVKEKFYNNSQVSYNEIIEMITNNISIYEPKAKDILVDLRMHMIDIFTSIFKDYNIMIVPKIDIVEMPYPASDDSNRGKKKKEIVISDILIFNKEDL